MKEVKQEADRLVELYKPMLTQYGVSDNFAKEDAIQCAIIDVSNTIEATKKPNIKLVLVGSTKRKAKHKSEYIYSKFWQQVKQELESRL